MPYKVSKVSGGYKVRTVKAGRPKYHSKEPMTLAKAKAQVRALYRATGGK
jgi:hypothetical protein